MGKAKWEEAILLLVPLAIVPLALSVMQSKQNPKRTKKEMPEPTRAKPQLALRPEFFRTALVTSRDGRLLYTSGTISNHPQFVHAWNARTQVYKRSFEGSAEPEGPLRLSPDGSTLYYMASRSTGSGGVLINIRSGRQRRLPWKRGQEIFHVGLGRSVLANVLGNTIELRSLRDGHTVGSLRAADAGFLPTSVAASPDGSLLSWIANRQSKSGNRDAQSSFTYGDSLVVYALGGKRRIFTRTLPEYNVLEAVVTGDNSQVVALANYNPDAPQFSAPFSDTRLLVFDLKNGRLVHKISLGIGNGVDLTSSPDGKWLALQSSDFRHSNHNTPWVQIVNLSTGQSQRFDNMTRHFTTFSADSGNLFIADSALSLQLTPGGRWEEAWFAAHASALRQAQVLATSRAHREAST